MKKRTVHTLYPMSALAFSLFAVFAYPYLPASIPMQFSVSGQVNWSLPTTYAILVFAGICLLAGGLLLTRYKQEERYPLRDALVALLLPMVFMIILIIALITK